MKRTVTESVYICIVDILKDFGYTTILKDITRENIMINGATFVEYSDTHQGRIFTYVEDDLVDENGNPYIFDYLNHEVFGEMEPGQRILALYVNNRHYLVPLNRETVAIVGASSDNYKVDRAKSKKLPTPEILSLSREGARPINHRDTQEIKKAVKYYGKFTAAKVVGSIALSLLTIMIVGLMFIFIVASMDNITPTVMIALASISIVIIIAGIIGSVKFFKNVYMRNVLKMKYIKEVMVAGISKSTNYANISIYEWVGNEVRFQNFEIGFAQLFLLTDKQYGDRIYMLTKGADDKRTVFDTRIFVSGDFIA